MTSLLTLLIYHLQDTIKVLKTKAALSRSLQERNYIQTIIETTEELIEFYLKSTHE